MNLASNNLQRLICHKIQPTKQLTNQLSPNDSFKNEVSYKLFVYKSYIYMYKQDLVLNNHKGLIYH